MNEKIVKDALLSALHLLNSEIESVIDTDLGQDYLKTITKIEEALKTL